MVELCTLVLKTFYVGNKYWILHIFTFFLNNVQCNHLHSINSKFYLFIIYCKHDTCLWTKRDHFQKPTCQSKGDRLKSQTCSNQCFLFQPWSSLPCIFLCSSALTRKLQMIAIKLKPINQLSIEIRCVEPGKYLKNRRQHALRDRVEENCFNWRLLILLIISTGMKYMRIKAFETF